MLVFITCARRSYITPDIFFKRFVDISSTEAEFHLFKSPIAFLYSSNDTGSIYNDLSSFWGKNRVYSDDSSKDL